MKMEATVYEEKKKKYFNVNKKRHQSELRGKSNQTNSHKQKKKIRHTEMKCLK